MSADPVDPSVPPAELAVARAVARRLGRPVFGVQTEQAGRRQLTGEPPDELLTVAYVVDPRGGVRFGPAGRAAPPADGAALVRDPATIAPAELALARDAALAAGATAFVAAPPPDEPPGTRLAFEPPLDGSLRYAVRPDGTLLVGADATAEPPRRVAEIGWPARTGAALRDLRRLRERADALRPLREVSARDWARLERLVPAAERRALRPQALLGRPGAEVADAIDAAAAREVARLRAEAGRLLR